MSTHGRTAARTSINSVPATASLKVANVDAFVQSRLAAAAAQDAEQRTAAVASTATVIARAFDNEAARTDPQSTLATVARLQGNQAAKAVRRIVLGEAERQRALCNTPEGLRQCHRVIEFLVDLHHRVALDCKGLLTVEARAGRLLWAEAYLSGMRYGVHRTLVKLFDQLSLDHSKTKIKSKSLFQQIGRETGFAPTEHGLHALTVALFRQLWRYSQESESYALSALVSSVPVGGPALTRLSSGSNGKLRGAFSKKQAIVFDSMEHALRAAFAARADGRALFLCYLQFAGDSGDGCAADQSHRPEHRRHQANGGERIVMTEDSGTQTVSPPAGVDSATSAHCPEAHALPAPSPLPRASRESERTHHSDPGLESTTNASDQGFDLLRLAESTHPSRRSNSFQLNEDSGVDTVTGLRHAPPHNPFLARHSTGMQPPRYMQSPHLPAGANLAQSYHHALHRTSEPAQPLAASACGPALPYMVSAPASWTASPAAANPFSPRVGPLGVVELGSPQVPLGHTPGPAVLPDLQRASWTGPAAAVHAAPLPMQPSTMTRIGRTSNNPFA